MRIRDGYLAFGEVADLYDQVRAGYPEAVFDAVYRRNLTPVARLSGAGTGHVAGRLAGRTGAGYLRDELGVELNPTAVQRAVAPRRWRAPGYRLPGRRAAAERGVRAGQEAAAATPAIRDWLAVDATALDLGVSLATVTVRSGRAQRDVYRALAQLIGVVQVLAVGDGRDRRVLALVLTDGEGDRRRVRALLDELADDWALDAVDRETVEPAVRTWRHLTRIAARRERLLGAAAPESDSSARSSREERT